MYCYKQIWLCITLSVWSSVFLLFVVVVASVMVYLVVTSSCWLTAVWYWSATVLVAMVLGWPEHGGQALPPSHSLSHRPWAPSATRYVSTTVQLAVKFFLCIKQSFTDTADRIHMRLVPLGCWDETHFRKNPISYGIHVKEKSCNWV